jgi:hypothetical protein
VLATRYNHTSEAGRAMKLTTVVRISVHFIVLCIAINVLLGCAQSSDNDAALPSSPTATTSNDPRITSDTAQGCPAPSDGSRAGYHSASGSTWISDCNNVLRREYWRVFLHHESAYIIPRPDGAPELQTICADVQHALRPLIDHYRLCSMATDTAHVKQVNNMKPADALQITHFLHTQLRFKAVDDGITPFPIPSDIIDACNLHPQANSSEFTAICGREQNRLKSGQDIGFTYTGPGARELAARLNELYGIE